MKRAAAADESPDDLGYRAKHFRELAALLESLTGVRLLETQKNTFLIAAKISPIMRRRRIESYDRYLELLRASLRSGDLEVPSEFVSAMMVHTTDFFRENRHFEILRDAVKARPDKELRVWSVATSTGQEAYSIAMTLMELAWPGARTEFRILATDLSVKALERGCQGIFSGKELAAVPAHMRHKYFAERKTGDRRVYRVKREVFSRIQFAPLNLLEHRFPFQYAFDIVFCRNVLIYFGQETATEVLEKIEGVLAPGGYLFLGHSEGGMVRSPGLKSIGNAVFRKVSHE